MSYVNLMQQVLECEAMAIKNAGLKLEEAPIASLINVFELLQNSGGNLVFSGVGKSGIIAKKIAATFTSLGLSSFFLHPVEALHGDLGRLRSTDAIVLISKSGSTDELLKLIPFLSIKKNMRIGLLGNIDSPIAQSCGVVFDCAVEKEVCINNQAPTTSTTVALAMGDAMAVLYESWIGLSQENFAVNHPGGILGKSLLMKVKDLMWKKEECPVLSESATLKDAVLEMTAKPVGACAVVNDDLILKGILVEGDIRRTFTRKNEGLETLLVDIMTRNPVKISPDSLAYEALTLMEKRKNQISILPILGPNMEFLGFIRLHDLLREGFSRGC